jgi:hypothetical protein
MHERAPDQAPKFCARLREVRRPLASLVALSLVAGTAPSRADQPATVCAYLPQDVDALAARGLVLAAREKYRACASACAGEERAQCEARLDALDLQIPRLRVVVRDKDGKPVTQAEVTIDGVDARAALAVPLELDPGTHLVRVISARVRGEQKVLLVLGDTSRTVAFDEPHPIDPNAESPEERSHGAGPWVVIGVGFTGIFLGIALAAAGQIDSDRNGNPNAAWRDPGIALTLGGLATVAGGLAWHYLEPVTAKRASGTWLSPWIAGNTLGAVVQRSF